MYAQWKLLLTSKKLTDFQRRVYFAALSIPLGQTRSYQWVAAQAGRPKAVRAVGSILRKNPWPLIVPCHRVIHADGRVGKYCGREDGRKKRLLDLEKDLAQCLTEGVKDSSGVSAQASRIPGSAIGRRMSRD